MTEHERQPRPLGGLSDELRPYVDSEEAAGINRIAERLQDERPFPRAAFRADLRAHLRVLVGARPAWRPRRLRRLVVAYAGSGLALLAIATIGLAGAGPLA